MNRRRRKVLFGGGGDPTKTLALSLLAASLPGVLTFSRASAATDIINGVLTSFASGAPRISTANGLLIEEARTNLTFGNTLTSPDTTITSGEADPLGGTSAFKVTETATTTAQVAITNTITLTGSAAHTISAFVKAGTCDRVQLRMSGLAAPANVYVNFYLNGAGSVSANGGGGTAAGITAMNNGWYLIWLSFVSLASPLAEGIKLYTLITGSEGGNPTILGTSRNYFIYGCQTEAGAFPTSYIPTTTASVTRAADDCTATLGAWFTAAQGTMVSEFLSPRAALTANRWIASINDGSTANRAGMFLGTGGNAQAIVTSASSGVYAPAGNAAVHGSAKKIAVAYQLNNFIGGHNAANFPLDTAGAVPVAPTILRLGGNHTATGERANAYIRSFDFYNVRKSDAAVLALVS